MSNRPNILSIAGFDPSGGAGAIADVKTFEQHKLQGLSVITANTIQTEDKFESLNWVDEEVLFCQLNLLLDRYSIRYAKIGLVKDAVVLGRLLKRLKEQKIVCVWDPILKPTAGKIIHKEAQQFKGLLHDIDYITPNWEEIEALTGLSGIEGGKSISHLTRVYLKGGHSDQLARDHLIKEGKVSSFKPRKIGLPKHGSGCIFSSAFVANLALGYPEIKACLRAKRYTEMRLLSNSSLLAYHES